MTYLHDRSWWGFWSDYIEHKIIIMKSKGKRVLKLKNICLTPNNPI